MRVLLFAFVTIASILPVEFATAAQLVKLESMAWDEVCGVDTKGLTTCVKSNGDATVIPETVGALTRGFSNELVSCGLDQGKVKCWKEWSGTDVVNGTTVAKAVRKLLESVKPETVKTSPWNICGELAASGELTCIVPNWGSISTRAFREKPKRKITAIGVDSDTICWGDGDLVESSISCRAHQSTWQWPLDMKMKGLIEIAVHDDRICARSKTEAQCWSPGAVIQLPADIITAKSWSFNSEGLCAHTQDSRIVCVDPVTGVILPTGLGNAIPVEYTLPNLDIKQLWTSSGTACVVHENGTVACWYWWNATAKPIIFSRPVLQLFGSSYAPCGMLDNGQVECRFESYESQTLKDTDRVRVAFGGWNKCFWNSSGVDCRGRVDGPSFRSVKDFATSQFGEAICAVGTLASNPSQIDVVQCASYYPEMRTPPTALRNPTAVATSADQACALSDEGLTCWGTPYPDIAYPANVFSATRLAMSPRHGCVIDQFGLACWGDLTALELEIPSGLEQPGRVLDVAVGASRTCAILDTGQVECWGRDYELSGPPPVLNGATSILGRSGLFCAIDKTGLHCWGGDTDGTKMRL